MRLGMGHPGPGHTLRRPRPGQTFGAVENDSSTRGRAPAERLCRRVARVWNAASGLLIGFSVSESSKSVTGRALPQHGEAMAKTIGLHGHVARGDGHIGIRSSFPPCKSPSRCTRRPRLGPLREDESGGLGWDAAGPDLPIGVDRVDGHHTLGVVSADRFRRDFSTGKTRGLSRTLNFRGRRIR
jgi:hypothetical protein